MNYYQPLKKIAGWNARASHFPSPGTLIRDHQRADRKTPLISPREMEL